MVEEHVLGTTIVLQCVYYNSLYEPIDVDPGTSVTVEILDGKARPVQTGLVATRTSIGTYQVKYDTSPLKAGTYYYVFNAVIDGMPDKKSASFVLKRV